MHWRRTIGTSVVVIAIVALLVKGFQPTPQQVDAALVERGPLRVSIEEEGKTRVVDRYIVSAPVAGYAHRITLNVGDAVQQGHALLNLSPLPPAVLDPRSRATALARIEAAKAAVEAQREKAAAAKAEYELAQLEHQRVVNLCKVQCASKDQEDQAFTRVRSTQAYKQSAQFAVDIARHDLAAAQTALSYAASTDDGEQLAITAPISGSVLKILRESEGVVGAGEPLIEIGNPHHLEVEVDVLSADAIKITPGTRALFERWGGGQPLEGRVRTVEPVGFTKVSALGVEEQRVLVISNLISDPERWQRLGDGYRVEASFILWEETDVLRIPASALFRKGDDWAVFVVDGDTAKRVNIKLGYRNGLSAQVLAGLEEGQQVITHPSETIEDGILVKTR